MPSGTGSKMTQKQAQEMLDEHNKRRTNIGKDSVSRHLPVPSIPLPPLEWDIELAKLAQEASDNMLASGSMFHNTLKLPDGRNVGQNIAFDYRLNASSWAKVSDWYDSEIVDFDYASNTCTPTRDNLSCGHATQIIWRDSTKIGCGVAKEGDTQYWTCDFLKPGNFNNRKPY